MLELLGRQHLGSNSRFSIHLDEVRSADDGFHIPNYLVVEPLVFNSEGVSGVAVLPFFQGKVGLLRMHRHAVKAVVWEIPRGFVDGNEHSSAAALRELEEETGLTTDLPNLLSLGYVLPEAGVMSAKIAVFAADHCRPASRPAGAPPPEKEFGLKSVEWFEWSTAHAMAQNSVIEDPCTITSLFRYKKTF